MSRSLLDPGQIQQSVYNSGNQSLDVTVIGGTLITNVYDNIQLGYTGANLTTVQYYLGAVLVNTLTLSYTGSNLTSVVKT